MQTQSPLIDDALLKQALQITGFQTVNELFEYIIRSNVSKTNEPKEQLDDDSNQESKWAKLAKRIEKEKPLQLGDYTEQFNRDRQEFRESFEFKHDL